MEAQLNRLKKETEDYISRCAVEARKMVEEVDQEAHDLDMVEREAAEVLKVIPCLMSTILKSSERPRIHITLLDQYLCLFYA